MKPTSWGSIRDLWPDQPEFDPAAFVRNSEQTLKDMQAHLDETHKFIEETPAFLRSDAPLNAKRRRRQQCLMYLSGPDDYPDPPQGEVVQFDRSQSGRSK